MKEFEHVQDIYERLDLDARRCHVRPGLLRIDKPQDLEDARELVNNTIAQGTVTAQALANRTGLSPSAISGLRNRRWKGNPNAEIETARQLVRAIDQLLTQRDAEKNRVGGYATTRFAEAVIGLCRYAQKRRLIAAFTTYAGMGKTTVLEHVRNETAGAVLIAVRKCRSRPKTFLQLWARAMYLQESGRAEDIQDRIIAALASSDRLILIDEAHKLNVATLDVIREIWDEIRVPIVLAGTPSLYQTLTSRRVGVQACELMDQLYSRIGYFRDLTQLETSGADEPEKIVSPEDVRKIFARGKVRLVPSGVDFLCKMANTVGAGGLRACTDLVQMVLDLFSDQDVSAETLQKALRVKLGPKEAGFRMDRAGITTERPAMAAVG